MPQSVEKALQIASDHQKRILEHMLRDSTSILKDKGTILEGLLACQKFAAYEDEAYALRNSVAGSSSAAGGNFDMLGMSAKLTPTDKHRLRAFVDESLETVAHWIQDIRMSLLTLGSIPTLTLLSLCNYPPPADNPRRKRVVLTSLFYAHPSFA
jgi:hypothetical protein